MRPSPLRPALAPARRGRAVTALLVAVTVVAGAAGAGLLGWTAWQGLGAPGAAAAQQRDARSVEQGWTGAPAPAPRTRLPVASEPAASAAVVATIRVPRFGASWVRTIRQGVGEDVLDSFTAGVGHYPGTAMPGGRGSFAIAGHDTGWGDAFRALGRLRAGDEIRVSDARGTYVYAFRNFRWVQPDHVTVLLPVPERPHAAATARLITLTTCDPPYHAEERFVAFGELVRFEPRRGAARSLALRPSAREAATVARLATALAAVRTPDQRTALAAASAVAAGVPVELTAQRTSVGRAVPAVQAALRVGTRCAVGQTGSRAAVLVRPVAGRCLIGSGTVRAG